MDRKTLVFDSLVPSSGLNSFAFSAFALSSVCTIGSDDALRFDPTLRDLDFDVACSNFDALSLHDGFSVLPLVVASLVSSGAIPTGGGCVAAGGGDVSGGDVSTDLPFRRADAWLRQNLPIASW